MSCAMIAGVGMIASCSLLPASPRVSTRYTTLWTRRHPIREGQLQRRQRYWLWVVGLCVAFGFAGAGAFLVNSVLRVMLIQMTPPVVLAAAPDLVAVSRRVPQQVLESGRNMFRLQTWTPAQTVDLRTSSNTDANADGDALDLRADDEVTDGPLVRRGPQRSDLPATLQGTMVAGDAAMSVALLMDHAARTERALRVGQHLYDAVVVRVDRTRVWLRRQRGQGALEYLALGEIGGTAYIAPPMIQMPAPHLDSGSASAATSDADVTSARGLIRVHEGARDQAISLSDVLREVDPASMIQRDAQGNYSLDLGMVRQHADATRLMADAMHLETVADAEGQVTGIRIGQVEAGSLFEHLGLRDQDVIVSVNGQPPGDERAALGFLEALAGEGEVAVEIDRRGRRLPLRLTTLKDR